MPYKLSKRDGKYCVVDDSGEVKQCYSTRSEALRLMRALYANVEDARADKPEDELDAVYREYHSVVNMSASELERWSESPCSRKASLSRSPITRNLHLLSTPKDKWGPREISWAKRTIRFVRRMKAMENGEPVSEGCPSARDISLMNWAHRPSSSRADIRAFPSSDLDQPKVACRRVELDDVSAQNRFWVLAAPFNVVDSFNSYFSANTDWRTDLTPENAPVFDYHGLRGERMDVEPLGRVIEWRTDEAGRWALVELNPEDERSERFIRAAAECNLQASVGMLRAGMFPQPPVSGVYEQPTELRQAPIVEVSLIVPNDKERAANPAAIGGFDFARRSQTMDQNINQAPCAQDVEALRAQIDALRAEVDKLAQEKENAMQAAAKERALRRREAMSQRMMQMQVPQSVINELMDAFDEVPEGAQDKIISVVGRMIDHIRATDKSGKDEESMMDAQRAAQRAVFAGQYLTANDSIRSGQQYDDSLIKSDLEWIKSRFAKTA